MTDKDACTYARAITIAFIAAGLWWAVGFGWACLWLAVIAAYGARRCRRRWQKSQTDVLE